LPKDINQRSNTINQGDDGQYHGLNSKGSMPHIKGAINKNYRQNMEVIGNHNMRMGNQLGNRNGSGPRHLSTNVSNHNLHGHNNSLGYV
jgi:hypothetical protein